MFVHNEKAPLKHQRNTHMHICMYSQRDGAYIHISQLVKLYETDYNNCLRQCKHFKINNKK